MKNIILFIFLIFLDHRLSFSMSHEAEHLIERIIPYSQISSNLDLIFEGKKLNIKTDQAGNITTTVAVFINDQVRHSLNSPTRPIQTITLNINGKKQVTNHNKK